MFEFIPGFFHIREHVHVSMRGRGEGGIDSTVRKHSVSDSVKSAQMLKTMSTGGGEGSRIPISYFT